MCPPLKKKPIKAKSLSISMLLTKNKLTNSYAADDIGEGRMGIKASEKIKAVKLRKTMITFQ
jgi:hypothetical protein